MSILFWKLRIQVVEFRLRTSIAFSNDFTLSIAAGEERIAAPGLVWPLSNTRWPPWEGLWNYKVFLEREQLCDVYGLLSNQPRPKRRPLLIQLSVKFQYQSIKTGLFSLRARYGLTYFDGEFKYSRALLWNNIRFIKN